MTTTAADPMTELMRLVERQHQELIDLRHRLERQHQEIIDLRNELHALQKDFANEQRCRRVLSGRFDSLERSAP